VACISVGQILIYHGRRIKCMIPSFPRRWNTYHHYRCHKYQHLLDHPEQFPTSKQPHSFTWNNQFLFVRLQHTRSFYILLLSNWVVHLSLHTIPKMVNNLCEATVLQSRFFHRQNVFLRQLRSISKRRLILQIYGEVPQESVFAAKVWSYPKKDRDLLRNLAMIV